MSLLHLGIALHKLMFGQGRGEISLRIFFCQIALGTGWPNTGMSEHPVLIVHHYKERIMKNCKGLLLMLMVALGVWGCAETTPKQELDVKRANVVSVTATVEKIDMKKRMVTIRGAEGNVVTIYAGKEVVNLPQVRVGDKVEIDYVQSLAVRMAKPGEVRNETAEMMARAKPGSKPGVVEVTETTVTATILALDKVNETATLKGPDGDVVVVKVQDPANLEKVKVGDTIVITYTEAAALSVRGKK
jgi:hypothetical protein